MHRTRFFRAAFSMAASLCIAISAAGCAKGGHESATSRSGPSDPSEALSSLSWLPAGHQFGSASMLLERNGLAVYVDPVRIPGVESLPDADCILITHSHGDHFAPGTVKELLKKGTVIVCTGDSAFPLQKLGIKGVKTVKPGDSLKVKGMTVKAVPMFTVTPDLGNHATHLESMGWAGFIVDLGGATYYFSGDSELTEKMESVTGVDVAVINLTAQYAVGAERAAAWAKAAKPSILLPVHWIANDASMVKELEKLKAIIDPGIKVVTLEQRE